MMHKPTPKLIALLTAAAFFAFFVFGFTDNLKGPTLPALLADLKLTYSQGGTILFGAYVGFLLATLFNGILSDVAGKKAPLLVAGACLALGIWGFSAFSNAGLLTAAMLVVGMGLGSIELGGNSFIVDLHPERKGLMLNWLAVFHGVGSMAAPIFAGRMLEAGQSWRAVYRWDWLLVGLLLAVFWLVRYPRPKVTHTTKINFAGLRQTAFTTEMGWFYFAIGVYVAVEIGVAAWIVEFLQKTHAQSVAASTTALSVFFLMVTVGRLAGSFFIERLGYLRSVLIATTGAGVTIALGVFGPSGFSFFLPLSGFFASIIFPTLTAEVSDRHQENMGAILGLLFTFAGVGGMLGPWLIGVGSDLWGIQLGFATNVAFCTLLALAIIVLMRFKSLERKSS